jgi:transposase-like protein
MSLNFKGKNMRIFDSKSNYISRVINILNKQIFSEGEHAFIHGFNNLIEVFHKEVYKMKDSLFVDLSFVNFLRVFSIIHSLLSIDDIDSFFKLFK